MKLINKRPLVDTCVVLLRNVADSCFLKKCLALLACTRKNTRGDSRYNLLGSNRFSLTLDQYLDCFKFTHFNYLKHYYLNKMRLLTRCINRGQPIEAIYHRRSIRPSMEHQRDRVEHV